MRSPQQMNPNFDDSSTPSRGDLRKLLDEHLMLDSELDAFLIDEFPDVKKALANSQDRITKVNVLFERKSTDYIYVKLADRVPSIAKLNQATRLPKYDEMESLQNELKSCSFGDNTLLDVLREAARKCSVDNYAEPSPAQVMSAISDVVESPELVEKAYWWLCVYGVFRFKDIDRWWSSGQNPVWTKSVGFVMLANRGRYLLRQLASEKSHARPYAAEAEHFQGA